MIQKLFVLRIAILIKNTNISTCSCGWSLLDKDTARRQSKGRKVSHAGLIWFLLPRCSEIKTMSSSVDMCEVLINGSWYLSEIIRKSSINFWCCSADHASSPRAQILSRVVFRSDQSINVVSCRGNALGQ